MRARALDESEMMEEYGYSGLDQVLGDEDAHVSGDEDALETYTAQASIGEINKGVTNHKNLESSDTTLLVFGNGDGGGGALPKMLENLRRARAAANNYRDLPPVSMGTDSLAGASQTLARDPGFFQGLGAFVDWQPLIIVNCTAVARSLPVACLDKKTNVRVHEWNAQ
ncbi:glycoside hydrolase family 38 protein [Scleroderma citrinum Foug A]|uniref:Glycoside hydrolase family 38 protein n=1 Tax=Scleroderma citrinum Foug A TaxID=1036808 RepID=A0A0C2ZU16_9AGAM|nr:glycoside hydrolase family 38 protein [Scleroderma citrinum Foug A]